MALLNCPVCQGAMREVNKEGVMIDTCTQCRGVWLDRGELERLAGLLSRAEAGFFEQREPERGYPRDRNDPRYTDRRRDYDDDDDDDRRRYGEKRPPSRMSRFMDLFD